MTDTIFRLLQQGSFHSQSYSCHSVRIEAATTAAAEGFPAWLIKSLGRWSSEAYLTYVRCPQEVVERCPSIFWQEPMSLTSKISVCNVLSQRDLCYDATCVCGVVTTRCVLKHDINGISKVIKYFLQIPPSYVFLFLFIVYCTCLWSMKFCSQCCNVIEPGVVEGWYMVNMSYCVVLFSRDV